MTDQPTVHSMTDLPPASETVANRFLRDHIYADDVSRGHGHAVLLPW